MAKITKFEDLNAWIEARKLFKQIDDLCKSQTQKKEYDLVNQIRRSAVSVMANIAEGFGRHGLKDAKNFYIMARGSLSETKSHLYALKDCGYISEDQFGCLYNQSEIASKILSGLISNVVSYLNSSNG